jgi:cell wall-associated NlpC family hydrolase
MMVKAIVSSVLEGCWRTGIDPIRFHVPTRVLLLAALAIAAAGCASRSGAVPRPFPTPGGGAPPVHTTAPPAAAPGGPAPARVVVLPPDAYSLTGTALALQGVPYINGGTSPAGFDCSGFVQWVFARHGISLPREVRDQFRVGSRVGDDDIAPGDLLFFTTVSRGPSHVAIAIGGDQFVHAPSSRGVVRIERLDAPYWRSRYLATHRLLNAD